MKIRNALAFAFIGLFSNPLWANVLTVNTKYDVSLDIHRTQIDTKNTTFLGASWVLEKEFGLFYGGALRVLASSANGFTAAAREKSLSVYYGGPTLGWKLSIHKFVGVAARILYGLGSVAYNENTGTYDENKNQKIVTRSSSIHIVEPGLDFYLGSYHDMQIIFGGGIRKVVRNAHTDLVPSEALDKPLLQLGIIKQMSDI